MCNKSGYSTDIKDISRAFAQSCFLLYKFNIYICIYICHMIIYNAKFTMKLMKYPLFLHIKTFETNSC